MCAFLGSHSAAVPGLLSGSWELLSEFFSSILLLLQLGWTCSLLVCGLLWCGRRSPCKIPAFLTIRGLIPSAGLRSCGCFWFVWVLLGIGLRWRLCSFVLKFRVGFFEVSRLFSIPSLRWLCARMLCISGFFQTRRCKLCRASGIRTCRFHWPCPTDGLCLLVWRIAGSWWWLRVCEWLQSWTVWILLIIFLMFPWRMGCWFSWWFLASLSSHLSSSGSGSSLGVHIFSVPSWRVQSDLVRPGRWPSHRCSNIRLRSQHIHGTIREESTSTMHYAKSLQKCKGIFSCQFGCSLRVCTCYFLKTSPCMSYIREANQTQHPVHIICIICIKGLAPVPTNTFTFRVITWETSNLWSSIMAFWISPE